MDVFCCVGVANEFRGCVVGAVAVIQHIFTDSSSEVPRTGETEIAVSGACHHRSLVQ